MTAGKIINFQSARDLRELDKLDVAYDIGDSIINALEDSGLITAESADEHRDFLDLQRVEAAQTRHAREATLHA